jgi:precorrin-6B C5,15-methyltransferase / cobalt-precorrin-6B C5,C15-methyltransferase
MQKPITVVGVGDDGCLSLSSRAIGCVAEAQVLVGGERHLQFFPQFSGEKIVIKGSLAASLNQIEERSGESRVCVLASGDPLFFGIGDLLARKLGAENVTFIPHLSSVQMAFSRLGYKWDDAQIISLHGRSHKGFITRLQRHSKVACLTDLQNSPQKIAQLMKSYQDLNWHAFVCENLGGIGERVRKFSISDLAECEDIGHLNVLVLLRNDPNWKKPIGMPYVHEDLYAKRIPKKGLITKREVRILSLAALQIRPDSVIWDIGAASGSITIEAAQRAYLGEIFAIETDDECIPLCLENCVSHKVDNVTVIHGRAPEALGDLPAPDAVFIGGSKGSLAELIQYSWSKLKRGGRLVANAITLDNVSEAYQSLRSLDLCPEVMMVNISRGVPLSRYLRYEAMNPIHIFAVTKTESTTEEKPKSGEAE